MCRATGFVSSFAAAVVASSACPFENAPQIDLGPAHVYRTVGIVDEPPISVKADNQLVSRVRTFGVARIPAAELKD